MPPLSVDVDDSLLVTEVVAWVDVVVKLDETDKVKVVELDELRVLEVVGVVEVWLDGMELVTVVVA